MFGRTDGFLVDAVFCGYKHLQKVIQRVLVALRTGQHKLAPIIGDSKDVIDGREERLEQSVIVHDIRSNEDVRFDELIEIGCVDVAPVEIHDGHEAVNIID